MQFDVEIGDNIYADLQIPLLGEHQAKNCALALAVCVDVQMQPYKLEDIKDKIDTAIKAKDGEIWSQQRAITFVGNVDAVMDEIEAIKEEQSEKQKNDIEKQKQLFSLKSSSSKSGE
jgi:folylpolyglutamate synthase/dihydropteroate synthase